MYMVHRILDRISTKMCRKTVDSYGSVILDHKFSHSETLGGPRNTHVSKTYRYCDTSFIICESHVHKCIWSAESVNQIEQLSSSHRQMFFQCTIFTIVLAIFKIPALFVVLRSVTTRSAWLSTHTSTSQPKGPPCLLSNKHGIRLHLN